MVFFQSKIRTEAIEANRQFGQIVYGKSGRIGSLARQIGADYACNVVEELSLVALNAAMVERMWSLSRRNGTMHHTCIWVKKRNRNG